MTKLLPFALLPFLAAGAVVDLGGLKSTAPASWKEGEVSSPMRIKQFAVAGKGKDAGDAEIVIFFFGQGQGGDVDANLKRWKGQFQPPQGKAIDDVSKVETVKLTSTKATLLDVRGTYMFKARPMDPGPGEARAGWRMLAAILETPKGNYFIRFVGPDKTVGGGEKDFRAWLKGFK